MIIRTLGLMLALASLSLLIPSCSGMGALPASTPELAAQDTLLQEFGTDLSVTRQTSSTYTRYLQDGMSRGTLTRWDTITYQGTGYWSAQLEGTRNYLHGPGGSLSELVSPAFTLPANMPGIKLVFHTRYSGLTTGKVQITTNGGDSWTDLKTYTGTDSSLWTAGRALIALPATGGSAQTALLRFSMDSLNNPNAFWDIDSLALYRKNVSLGTPQNLTVVEGPYRGTKRITWTYPSNAARPGSFRIYTGTSATGQFSLLTEYYSFTVNPVTGRFTVPVTNTAKFYKVSATRSGYPESDMSNAVSVGGTVTSQKANVTGTAYIFLQNGQVQPLPNAAIYFLPGNDVELAKRAVASPGFPPVLEATAFGWSSSDGTFSIPNVPFGTNTLWVTWLDTSVYRFKSFEIDTVNSTADALLDGSIVVIQGGGGDNGGNGTVVPASVSGNIVLPDGITPVDGATVSLTDINGLAIPGFSAISNGAQSGFFAIDGLNPIITNLISRPVNVVVSKTLNGHNYGITVLVTLNYNNSPSAAVAANFTGRLMLMQLN